MISPSTPEISNKRRRASAKITLLAEASPAFSYLRLGDGELRFLLAIQSNTWKEADFTPQAQPSIEYCIGTPGLQPKDYAPLLRAYEECTWLDRCEVVPYVDAHLSELKWNRSPTATGNPDPETSLLFPDWAWHEMKSYLGRHRSLFCGAEAALQRELLADPAYRRIASRFWPEQADVFFLQPHRDGKFLSEDFDRIKQQLLGEIERQGIDTLFLGLGGIAKILCHEISREKQIRAFDCGSLLRGLTYSGSDGQSSWRSSHHPFFIRVPFGIYMSALQRAHPDMDSITLIAKAHAQLCLELMRKEPLKSHTCDLNDLASYVPSPANHHHFLESYAVYRRHYYPWARKQPKLIPLLNEFRRWRRIKGLGFDGQLLQLLRRAARFLLRR